MTAFARFPFARGAFAGLGPSGAESTETPRKQRALKSPKLEDGNYVRDADGFLVDGDPIDEEVRWRLRTVVNSFIGNPKLGANLLIVQVLNRFTIIHTRDQITQALQPMISRGTISDLVVIPMPYAVSGLGVNDITISYTKTRRRK